MQTPPMLVLDTPPRWRGWLLVVAVHALLLMGLGQAHRSLNGSLNGSLNRSLGQPERTPSAHQPGSTLRMVTIQLPPLRHRDATAIPTATRPARGPQQPERQRPLAPDTSRATAAVDAAAVAAAATAHAASRATRAASAPTLPLVVDAQRPLPSESAPALPSREPSTLQSVLPPAPHAASGPSGHELMEGAATRLAVRQSTRGAPLLSERADQASQAPERLDASARLGHEIKEAGNGDCLKGEYAGGGMGLLSAPFLLLAKARGKCAK